MRKYVGQGVFGAIAMGKAVMYGEKNLSVNCTETEDIATEWSRVEYAKAMATKQLQEVYEKAVVAAGEENAKIFETHMMMLEDEDYNTAIKECIFKEHRNAEYAVTVIRDRFVKRFATAEDAYMQARATDIKDISNRILACLMVSEAMEGLPKEKGIVCAGDLTPSETIALDRERVLAFVTAQGSLNSHTAILAKTMNVPAIVGVGSDVLEQIRDGMEVIVDGYSGTFIVEPDAETVAKYLKLQREETEKKELLQKLKGKENVTVDGMKIQIHANVGSEADLNTVLENDADGIGLFRSECLYLGKEDYPTEEEQFGVYKRVLEKMAPKRVIIRTLDMGSDKCADYLGLEKEENPALGLRGIRICLMHPEMFRTQLRALYRASAYGKLGILFPMITDINEVDAVLELCRQVKEQLAAEGVAYDEEAELGIMIETPAAAIISDKLAPKVDFFSVGTNDLTQYTLACDRQNSKLGCFCDTHHEAVLRLIELTARNAHANGIWIGICGEMAADTTLTKAFLRMRIDELSVAPGQVLRVRDVVRNIDLREA